MDKQPTEVTLGQRQGIDAYIAKTAELVQQNGKLPTYGELRMAMGGVGSQSTLRDAINSFKASLEVREQKKADFQAAPEAFTSALLGDFEQMLGSIWRKANELSEAKLEAARKAIDAERMEWEQERKQIEDLNEQLEQDIQKERENVQAKADQLANLDSKLIELTDQITDLKIELGQEKTKADERGLRVAALEGQLKEKVTELEKARENNATTIEKLHQAQSERDVLKAKLDAADSALSAAQAETKAAIEKQDTIRKELEAKVEAKNKEVKEATAGQLKAEAEMSALTSKVASLEKKAAGSSGKTPARKINKPEWN